MSAADLRRVASRVGVNLLGAMAGVSGLGPAAAVSAQDLFARNGNVAVLDRPHPEWDPVGVHVGVFDVLPSITSQVGYDDNIFATPTDSIPDEIFTIKPGVAINSNWNQNSLNLTAGGVVQRYVSNPAQNDEQYNVDAKATLNVYHDLDIFAEAGHQRTLEPRTSDGYARESITPLLFDETLASLGTAKTFNRLKLTVKGTFENLLYHDGVAPGGAPLNQSFQDRDSYQGFARGDYALSPAVALFLEETVTHDFYDKSSFRQHDSTQTLFGPNFEITHLITAELGAGYLTSSFHDPRARDVGNFTGRAMFQYFPTQLVTLTLQAQQAVIDSGLPTTPAFLSRGVEAEVDYELLRNLIISAKAGGSWNSFRVIDRRDKNFSASLGATYHVSRAMGLGLTYNRTQRESDGLQAGRGFDDDMVSLAVTLQR